MALIKSETSNKDMIALIEHELLGGKHIEKIVVWYGRVQVPESEKAQHGEWESKVRVCFTPRDFKDSTEWNRPLAEFDSIGTARRHACSFHRSVMKKFPNITIVFKEYRFYREIQEYEKQQKPYSQKGYYRK